MISFSFILLVLVLSSTSLSYDPKFDVSHASRYDEPFLRQEKPIQRLTSAQSRPATYSQIQSGRTPRFLGYDGVSPAPWSRIDASPRMHRTRHQTQRHQKQLDRYSSGYPIRGKRSLQHYRRVPPKSAPKLKSPAPVPQKSKTSAGHKIELYEPGGKNDVTGRARAANAADKRPLCKTSYDCNKYCSTQKVGKPGAAVLNSCVLDPKAKIGKCQCSDATEIEKLIVVIGVGVAEMACQVWTKAFTMAIDIGTTLIPGGIAVSLGQKAAMAKAKAALKGIGKANKAGVLDFCSHKIVKAGVVDDAIPFR